LRLIFEVCSFLKKRTKRLLILPLAAAFRLSADPVAGVGIKVFWFFSSEKNTLPFLLRHACHSQPIGEACLIGPPRQGRS
jgi:hypothetical protein